MFQPKSINQYLIVLMLCITPLLNQQLQSACSASPTAPSLTLSAKQVDSGNEQCTTVDFTSLHQQLQSACSASAATESSPTLSAKQVDSGNEQCTIVDFKSLHQQQQQIAQRASAAAEPSPTLSAKQLKEIEQKKIDWFNDNKDRIIKFESNIYNTDTMLTELMQSPNRLNKLLESEELETKEELKTRIVTDLYKLTSGKFPTIEIITASFINSWAEKGINFDDVRIGENNTPLLNFLVEQNRIDPVSIQTLLDHCNPNVKDNLGRTSLYWAVKRHNPDMVKRLLHHGAVTLLKDNMGNNALNLAVQAKEDASIKIICLLLSHGANSEDLFNFNSKPLLTDAQIRALKKQWEADLTLSKAFAEELECSEAVEIKNQKFHKSSQKRYTKFLHIFNLNPEQQRANDQQQSAQHAAAAAEPSPTLRATQVDGNSDSDGEVYMKTPSVVSTLKK